MGELIKTEFDKAIDEIEDLLAEKQFLIREAIMVLEICKIRISQEMWVKKVKED